MTRPRISDELSEKQFYVYETLTGWAGKALVPDWISDEDFVEICGLSSLTFLDLCGYKIPEQLLKQLRNLSRLEVLDLSYTGLSGHSIANLPIFPELVSLKVAGIRYVRAILPFVLQSPELTELNVSDTDVDVEFFGAVVKKNSIDSIKVRNTRITYDDCMSWDDDDESDEYRLVNCQYGSEEKKKSVSISVDASHEEPERN